MCCCDKPKTEMKSQAATCCGATKTELQTETDPVCGMKVDPAKAEAHEEHGDNTYYFCSSGCAIKFHGEPEKYL